MSRTSVAKGTAPQPRPWQKRASRAPTTPPVVADVPPSGARGGTATPDGGGGVATPGKAARRRLVPRVEPQAGRDGMPSHRGGAHHTGHGARVEPPSRCYSETGSGPVDAVDGPRPAPTMATLPTAGSDLISAQIKSQLIHRSSQKRMFFFLSSSPSEDRVGVNCSLVNAVYPAEWMAEAQFRTASQ